MTYTFKLARRLAVSRTFGMLPAILLIAACSGDATAPASSTDPLGPQDDWRPRAAVPVMVSVNPTNVTVETNQLIRFLAYGRNSAGDSVYAPIAWHATGGTILPDGRFSSAAVGTFMVTARARDRGEESLDTSTVTVVRRHIQLFSIDVDPGSATLAPGVSQRFAAIGFLKSGRAVPVGVAWNATGGTIDAGGNYVAGDTAGTYHVIATNPTSTIADTAVVTITALPAPPPPPAPAPPEGPEEPAPPPAPALAKVTLVPASATLAPSATRQFAAYGRTTAGDSVVVGVTFSATGGSVTPNGLYTAGATAGTFRVIARADGLADTSTVTVTKPLGSGPMAGVGIGYWHTPPEILGPIYNGAVFNGNVPSMLDRLQRARATGARVAISLARNKTRGWDPITRDTALSITATRQYLATWPDSATLNPYFRDGTLAGILTSDDILSPAIWGKGAPHLARIDSLALLVEQRYGKDATTFVRATPTQMATKPYTYRWLDYAWGQYSNIPRLGAVIPYRDAELAKAKAIGLCLAFGLNVVGHYDMSPAELTQYAAVFLPYTPIFTFWEYRPAYASRPDIVAAMRTVRALADATPRNLCKAR